ncbi:MAG: iron-containing alcohol dehydrogenase, partial [Sphingomicrobium sp.]
MDAFTFHPGPKLLSGDGSAACLVEVLPDGPCLFVTDRDVVAFGLTDACRSALEAGGREIILFDAVEADPSKDTLLAAVDLGRRHDVTHVVGFGGGSPMDVAKLAAYLIGSADDLD